MCSTSKDRLSLYHSKNGPKHVQQARDIVNKTIHNWLIHCIYNVNTQMELSIFYFVFCLPLSPSSFHRFSFFFFNEDNKMKRQH